MRRLYITTTANHNNRPVIILLFERLLKPVVYLTSYTTTVFSSKHHKSFIYFLLDSYIINWYKGRVFNCSGFPNYSIASFICRTKSRIIVLAADNPAAIADNAVAIVKAYNSCQLAANSKFTRFTPASKNVAINVCMNVHAARMTTSL